MLYLHETIDIIGTGQEAYLETVGKRAEHSTAAGISRLVGCWKIIGSTNRWPAVVNLWEMDSWAHWSETLERQFVPEKTDAALAPWWAKTAEYRRGGFDRILEPAPGCPTLADLQTSGLSSWVCGQTIARALPGKGEALLALVRDRIGPLLERAGCSVLGNYHVPMRSDEIVYLWAAPTFAVMCALEASKKDDTAWRSLQPELTQLQRESETLWLTPAKYCFFHPQA